MSLNSPGQEALDFNRDIRPILSDNCFLCHGPDASNRKADLRLDRRQSVLDLGAIVPGHPEDSELMARIESSDPDLVMPPPHTKKKLSAEQIARIQEWIAQDAPYAEHWAFVPPVRPSVPPTEFTDWKRNDIDAFTAQRMKQHGLQPSAPADRVTLIRRLYLDLIGLPPTPAQVDAFVRDTDPHAADHVIDDLLNSPHFGERWARWWLDAARYSDSDGYEKDKQRSVWFYRDWVIQAMNRDMPYDQFIIQQIAGDLLPDAGQDERVATGFLRNSMVNEEGGADPEQFRIEGMFDRMDAVGKAILGITTQCAQCHSHKYDPLTQREYYQMFAALNDFHEGMMTAFTSEQDVQRREIEGKIAGLSQQIKSSIPDWRDRVVAWASDIRSKTPQWTSMTPTDLPFDGQKFRVLDDGSILGESYAPTKTTSSFSLKTHVSNITAVRLDALTHPQLPRGGPGRSIDGTGALTEFRVSWAPADNPSDAHEIAWSTAYADANPAESELPAAYRERNAAEDDRVTGPIAMAIDKNNKTAWTTDVGPGQRNQNRHAVFVPDVPAEVNADVILTFTMVQNHGGWNSDDNQNYLLGRYRFSITADPVEADVCHVPSDVQEIVARDTATWSEEEWNNVFDYWRTTQDSVAELNEQIAALWARFPETDSQLVAVAMESPRTTHVMERGNFLNPGDVVTPDAPSFLNPFPATNEPDRLRFAQWLVADDAPTTARVIVNRVWQAYFGHGIVTSPEDFGSQSEPPTHPELLDWLAVELMENNWQLKHIHRLIVNSATYRQTSAMDESVASQDPYNVWLARGPRFRVDAEVVRDIALSVSGLLNDQIGGPSVYPPAPEFLFQPPASYGPKNWFTSTGGEQYRRSVYVHSYRSVPYPVLQVFDAPKGDAACIRRERSNTPLQALVVLNEPQFFEAARALAFRVLREAGPSDQQRIIYAHRLCVSREPTTEEQDVLLTLLNQQRERLATGDIDAEAIAGAPAELLRQLTGLDANDAVPWIIVSRALLNLDETIAKQ